MVYVARMQELLIELNQLGHMLGKRGIDMESLPDYLSDAKKGSIFVNTECMSFSEKLESLKGKKKQQYLDILAWKRMKGVKLDEDSLKFEQKCKEEDNMDNSKQYKEDWNKRENYHFMNMESQLDTPQIQDSEFEERQIKKIKEL